MYEVNPEAVKDALTQSSSEIFSSDTIESILKLATNGSSDTTVTFDTVTTTGGQVNAANGSEVVFVNTSDTVTTVLTPPANAPVVIFQGKGGVTATFDAGVATVPSPAGNVDRVVVGSAGDDRIIISDNWNTKIILGTGDSTVVTGGGVDTVEAGLGNSTIVGGSGDYAVVKLGGNRADYTVGISDGHAVLTDTAGRTTDISKIQYVQLDNGNALVFARDSVEAAVSTLYEIAFGRSADAGGLDYWFDLARSGVTLRQIAEAFTSSSEFASIAQMDNDAFVNSLYQNTFGRAGEDAGVAYWMDALDHGSSRADLIQQFSQIAVQNISGGLDVEATIIGSVSIVTGIV